MDRIETRCNLLNWSHVRPNACTYTLTCDTCYRTTSYWAESDDIDMCKSPGRQLFVNRDNFGPNSITGCQQWSAFIWTSSKAGRMHCADNKSYMEIISCTTTYLRSVADLCVTFPSTFIRNHIYTCTPYCTSLFRYMGYMCTVHATAYIIVGIVRWYSDIVYLVIYTSHILLFNYISRAEFKD